MLRRSPESRQVAASAPAWKPEHGHDSLGDDLPAPGCIRSIIHQHEVVGEVGFEAAVSHKQEKAPGSGRSCCKGPGRETPLREEGSSNDLTGGEARHFHFEMWNAIMSLWLKPISANTRRSISRGIEKRLRDTALEKPYAMREVWWKRIVICVPSKLMLANMREAGSFGCDLCHTCRKNSG